MNVAYNADCLAAMREMPDHYFDLAVVDPPYGLKISHNMGRRRGEKPSDYKKVDWDDAPPTPEYFAELRRVSKNQIVWGANHFVSMIPAADSHCWLCWDKKFSEDVSFASFELAWTSFDQPCKRLALSSAQIGRIHPTQKPVALYAWIFSKFAKPGDRILDTHLGSGSSRIAAWDAGLDFVGYEIDPDHFQAQQQRFDEYTAQLSIFGGGGYSDYHYYLRCHILPTMEETEMEITVKMTAEEFAEFMEFRKDHDVNGKRVKSLRDDLVLFCKKLLWAVTPNDKKPGTYKITDQDHMDDLVLMADHYKE